MVGDILKKCNKQGLAYVKWCDYEISHGYGSSGGGEFFARYICGAKTTSQIESFS